MQKNLNYIKDYVISIYDFPKKGVNFRDITPIFQKPNLINDIIDAFYLAIKDKQVDYIAGIESRGFLFGVPLALKLNKPFVLIRKPNKLPRETYKQEFILEYGSSVIELQKDDIKVNANVVIIDDLLATGGTIQAAEQLIKKSGANPICDLFLIELSELKGRKKLVSPDIYTILKY